MMGKSSLRNSLDRPFASCPRASVCARTGKIRDLRQRLFPPFDPWVRSRSKATNSTSQQESSTCQAPGGYILGVLQNPGAFRTLFIFPDLVVGGFWGEKRPAPGDEGHFGPQFMTFHRALLLKCPAIDAAPSGEMRPQWGNVGDEMWGGSVTQRRWKTSWQLHRRHD